MTFGDGLMLAGAGLAAGVVNSLAGGGSFLSVSLLVVLGLPGMVANGTNRVGVLIQSLAAARAFHAKEVEGLRDALPLLAPVLLGSAIGAFAISRVADATFEKLFGVLMVLALIPLLRRPARPVAGNERGRPGPGTLALFFGIGLYGGAFQAGIGIALVLALAYAGFDLVRANSIKVVIVAALTAVALPVFALQGQIAWLPALVLSGGFLAGGELGARAAVRGGERLIRPVLVLAVLALAGRLLGLY